MIGVGTENVALHRSNFEYIDLIGKFNKKNKTCVSYVHMCDCNVIKLVLRLILPVCCSRFLKEFCSILRLKNTNVHACIIDQT